MTIEELVSGMTNPIKDKSHPLYGFDVYGCYDVIIDFTDESGHSDFAEFIIDFYQQDDETWQKDIIQGWVFFCKDNAIGVKSCNDIRIEEFSQKGGKVVKM